jgi:hypothetical protein
LRVACQQGDGLEVLHDVVLKTVDGAVRHMRAEEAGAKRIAAEVARATRPVPIVPAAPVTFSITMG